MLSSIATSCWGLYTFFATWFKWSNIHPTIVKGSRRGRAVPAEVDGAAAAAGGSSAGAAGSAKLR